MSVFGSHFLMKMPFLGLMQTNLTHPSLHTHKMHEPSNSLHEEVFETYAENHTPGAYRVFWCYGKEKGLIQILSIQAHG